MFYYLMLGLSNFFNFKERATRKEYWFFKLTTICIFLAFSMLVGFTLPSRIAVPVQFSTSLVLHSILDAFLMMFMLITAVASISLLVRRLHDIGKSGWWYLSPFVPFVIAGLAMFFLPTAGKLVLAFAAFIFLAMAITLLVFSCLKSQPLDNKYGKYVEDISVSKKPLNRKAIIKSMLVYVLLVVLTIPSILLFKASKFDSNKQLTSEVKAFIHKTCVPTIKLGKKKVHVSNIKDIKLLGYFKTKRVGQPWKVTVSVSFKAQLTDRTAVMHTMLVKQNDEWREAAKNSE